MRVAVIILVGLFATSQAQTVRATYNFDCCDAAGYNPLDLTATANGNVFYGVTQAGGANGFGTIFRTNVTSKGFNITPLFAFAPYNSTAAPLTLGADGNLYGTLYGSAVIDPSQGAIFEYNVASGAFSTLYSFSGGVGGGMPAAALAITRHGVIYGTTSAGGDPICNCGTLFSFDTTTNAFTTLHVFQGPRLAAGASVALNPDETQLVGFCVDPTAKFAGRTSVYAFDLTSANFTILHTLNQRVEGAGGQPVFSREGNAFGVSYPNFVYRLGTKGGFQVIGQIPNIQAGGTLRFGTGANAHTFYGTSNGGGAGNGGGIFSYNVITKAAATLYSFPGNTDCIDPFYNEVFPQLHGTVLTGACSNFGKGSLYQISVP